jgi:hypothetical protein
MLEIFIDQQRREEKVENEHTSATSEIESQPRLFGV